MSGTANPTIPKCPSCGVTAFRSVTSYGIRDACNACGLWGWDGRELVSEHVHRGRQHCHEKVDALWNDASWIDMIAEALGEPGTPEHERVLRRVKKRARNITYTYLAATLELPGAEIHMSNQSDIPTLRRIYALAARTTPSDIQTWACAQGRDVRRSPPTPAPAPREGPARNKPCPCGSGHKYKKCHGARVSRASEPPGL
jgi:hypothetical protein